MCYGSTTIHIDDDKDVVFGKDDCTYQQVVNEFDNAEYIFISTFNITAKESKLLNRLKEIENANKIIFISNIPGQ